MPGRRLLVLLVVLAAVGIPAGVLRALCVGNACRDDGGKARIPFCPLPAALKADLVAGYREGRSPDVLAVARAPGLAGGSDTAASAVPWPSLGGNLSTRVPIAFAGTGVARGAAVPDGTTLARIAPTVADVLGFDRPFPKVRSGTAIEGLASGERPRLVLEVAWKGAGTETLEAEPDAWPFLRSLLADGAGTLAAVTGSLPVDPAATLTTIGTGGPPSEHGITGTSVRSDEGVVARAWGDGAPLSIIATLPEDLDEAMGQRSLIGLAASDPADRGIVGGDWYPGHDLDEVAITRPDDVVAAALDMLRSFGRDEVPDVLAVVLDGSVRAMDRWTRQLVAAAERASGDSVLVVVAGTGAAGGPGRPALADVLAQVEEAVPGERPVIHTVVPGGLFLDRETLVAEGITGQAAVDALLAVTGPEGERMMADAFQEFAVSFARYC